MLRTNGGSGSGVGDGVGDGRGDGSGAFGAILMVYAWCVRTAAPVVVVVVVNAGARSLRQRYRYLVFLCYYTHVGDDNTPPQTGGTVGM